MFSLAAILGMLSLLMTLAFAVYLLRQLGAGNVANGLVLLGCVGVVFSLLTVLID